MRPLVTAALLALMIGVACAVVASTSSEFGPTWDEPEHLAAGMELLDQGLYQYDLQHPPLGRLMIALGPWLAGAHSRGNPPPDGRVEGLAILRGGAGGDAARILRLARAGMLPFLALLLLASWYVARSVLDPPGALLAAAFVASTPTLLGHAGLAALDVPAAGTCLLAIFMLQRWMDAPRAPRAFAFALAAGIAIATKLSAIPFLLVAGVTLALAHRACGAVRAAHPVRDTVLALVTIGAVINLAYGWHFSDWTGADHRYSQTLNYLFGTSGGAHDAAYRLAAGLPLPDGWRLMIGGIQAVQVHNAQGHLSYLLGENSTNGWWYFYPVTLSAKTPLPMLLLGMAGLLLMLRGGWRERDARTLMPPLAFLSILVFACSFSHINIGVRHVLVLLPLLAIGAAYASVALWRSVRRELRIGVVVLLAWQLSVLPRAWPDYLAWFNEAVAEPAHVSVDSDLDWGQDLLRLERRLAQLKVEHVAIAYSGSVDLENEPLPPFERLPPGVRTRGWVAISALARAEARGGYGWLDFHRPVERIGRTIDLYDIRE
jgi:4-amino-4-deoxy-L-arabinose transferase-like glycosyltransferase